MYSILNKCLLLVKAQALKEAEKAEKVERVERVINLLHKKI